MAGFNKAYAQHFKQNFPARCALEAGPLPYGAGVTLEMIAAYSDRMVVNPTPGQSTNPNPRSPAIKTNEFLFLSGQIPRDLFTGKVDKVYSQYFPSEPPALTVLGVSKMNSAVSVEIEMTAISK